MFLRKWKLGQVAIGLLLASVLVLGGINVTGLVQGEKAIGEAEAIWFPIILWLPGRFDQRMQAWVCDSGDARCIIIINEEGSVTLTPGGIAFD